MSYTFSIIKPDAYKQRNEIISKIILSGFNILKSEERKLSIKEAKEFYSIHKEKPFYEDLIEFMTSGPIVILVISSEGDTVNSFRKLIGDTDPKKAEKNSIRSQYGTDISRNSIHGADSSDNAKREILFFFPGLSYLFDKKIFKKYQEFIIESNRLLSEGVTDKIKPLLIIAGKKIGIDILPNSHNKSDHSY
jgi:nucleoside-diphosphate kinase